jgi:hypothetical protein
MSIWIPFERAHQTELFNVFFKIIRTVLSAKKPDTGYFRHKITPLAKIRTESKKFSQNTIFLIIIFDGEPKITYMLKRA